MSGTGRESWALGYLRRQGLFCDAYTLGTLYGFLRWESYTRARDGSPLYILKALVDFLIDGLGCG